MRLVTSFALLETNTQQLLAVISNYLLTEILTFHSPLQITMCCLQNLQSLTMNKLVIRRNNKGNQFTLDLQYVYIHIYMMTLKLKLTINVSYFRHEMNEYSKIASALYY